MAYRVLGRPGLAGLVLIHGFPNASGGFRHVIPGLSEVARVIAPDMPGSGASEPLPDPGFDAFVEATAHLNAEEFVRAQYVEGLPADVASRIAGEPWKEDWAVLNQPGRLQSQKALILDNGRTHVARFGEYARYFRERQPPALMIWGRHDPYFALEETLDWLEDFPRMEAHILDGGHLLLETHASQCLPLMTSFICRHA